ncbi:DPP IV N-terminal domain-containing protein [Balneolales bacterium ANBcel1]|nr:DPP IV N-terminal domain-containing protein [Balneolales bacterium ANBcel1]
MTGLIPFCRIFVKHRTAGQLCRISPAASRSTDIETNFPHRLNSRVLPAIPKQIAAGKLGFLGVMISLLSFSACSTAHQAAADRPSPASSVTEEDYRRAEELLSWNAAPKVYFSGISPQWIDDDRFWYRTRTDTNSHRFFLVDPASGDQVPAFDHERLAESLTELLEADEEIESGDLPFRTFRYIRDESAILFEANSTHWECDLDNYRCRESERESQPENSVLSPDERLAAFIRDHNLWIRDMETGEEFALTTAGEYRYGFGTNSQGWFHSERPVLNWSPDSRKIATYRLDERDVAEMHLLETAQDRPVLESWPYALPGDTIVPMHERVILDVESRTKIWIDSKPAHQRTSNCCGLERDGQWADIAWSEDASQMAFVNTSRDYRRVDLYIADTRTGDVRHVLSEEAETFFESNLTSRGAPNWRVLFDREEVIWFSRRDEWGHLYLHRLGDGSQVARITKGAWNVVDVLVVDEASGDIYFTAAGREEGRDPYLAHLYRVNIGSYRADDAATEGRHPQQGDNVEPPAVQTAEPVLLTPEPANHDISVSPSGRFFVDEYSSFREPSVTVVRDGTGAVVMTVAEADITGLLESPWTLPEPFVTLARDGETDLHGVMYKPSGFDPANRYPVVINIYPGPQVGSVGTRSFAAARRGQVHALAELGFVVIQLDALGTPLRSKSFHTAWYGDMSDNGIPDQIAAIRQLAERYDWLDDSRAGIYGHSGGGYATVSALLDHPGVFKAGVASAGNLDNRGYTYYWGEKYQGQRIINNGDDTFATQAIWTKADQLEDRLLLSYGTMDNNVHPNMTLLFINELIEENKDFDLIVMPNRDHGFANERYMVRRTWDFFVRHLLDAEPPHEFRFE